MLQNNFFHPKILSTFKDYDFPSFVQDLFSGVIVGIVALPLAIAFGVASGVTPEAGIITAIIAGFIISLLGGSRVQIGGPTGAFIVVVFGIIQQYGVSGLIISTIMAGFILITMGLLKAGDFLKFIPAPVITGFTSGIALVIFTTQVKDFFGLNIESIPSNFLGKWSVIFQSINTVNWYALAISILTIFIILGIKKYSSKVPSTFIALIVTTGLAILFDFPVETIGSRFGEITPTIPTPSMPSIDISMIQELIAPAFTIALLGAIESLLSAVVSDSMIGGKHRSNTELIGQGIANIITPFFGGLPATGAIARTATNVKNGGRTPIAGIVHALVLLMILLFLSPFAAMIPMATLAGILAIVSYNMSEWREFKNIFRAPQSDIILLLTTFFLTVLFDLTLAIQVGIVLSAFFFMNRMAKVSNISLYTPGYQGDVDEYYARPNALSNLEIPSNVDVYEINGAFFFGAVGEFDKVIRGSLNNNKNIILRMNNVPTLDATGLNILLKLHNDAESSGRRLILTELTPHCLTILKKSNLYKIIKDDIFSKIDSSFQEFLN